MRRAGAGDIFPDCRFVILNAEKDKKYLDIPRPQKEVSLAEIETPFLFIELYNEFCSACLDEVKTFKSLFSLLERNERIGEKIRMLGIGVGSKKRHVVAFRKENGIPFPLFADEDRSTFECLGSPSLPTAYLLRRLPDGKRRIVRVQSGHIEDLNLFMKEVETLVNSE